MKGISFKWNSAPLDKILGQHHWGKRKLPIRNIVAMTDHRPRGKFHFVAVNKLNGPNGHIGRFEPIFDAARVRAIAGHLLGIKSKNIKTHQ